MAASKIKTSDVASKRRVARSKTMFMMFFQDALNALVSSDEEPTKAISLEEARELATSAANVAEAAIDEIESRYPGL